MAACECLIVGGGRRLGVLEIYTKPRPTLRSAFAVGFAGGSERYCSFRIGAILFCYVCVSMLCCPRGCPGWVPYGSLGLVCDGPQVAAIILWISTGRTDGML